MILHMHHKEIEVAVAAFSILVLSLVMPAEELIDDLIDRIARGELEPVLDLIKEAK